jgi:hypothetical protein
MNQLQELRSTDPVRRLQAIAQSARGDNTKTLPILRQIQQSDPIPSLRDFASKAIERIEQQKITKVDFMANIDQQQKSPATPSLFAEEIVRLSPANTPRSTLRSAALKTRCPHARHANIPTTLNNMKEAHAVISCRWCWQSFS